MALAAALLAPAAMAQNAGALPVLIGAGSGSTSYSVPIQTLLFFTALSFLPAVLLMMTGFTRIVIVLSLLRQAIGTQSAPPNQVIVGLSLFLTFFVMGPTLDRVYQEAYVPYTTNALTFEQALEKAEAPMRGFMLKQTRQSDFSLFSRLAKLPEGTTAETAPLRVLVPAFVTSELKSAFQIGFMIFIPFLVIDMVVSSILMSLGMMMLSPVLVALPFKLMLFVLADGWNLLIGSLAASFAV
ncbi:MAG: flagellar biosynthesis protein FliP [Comamonadaceae bacterium]|nr:MAG: flagellar biosynthesis protein FliP [Comamonadaceae bacterium]